LLPKGSQSNNNAKTDIYYEYIPIDYITKFVYNFVIKGGT
jgi:uncharacterized protein (UPF0333 family)